SVELNRTVGIAIAAWGASTTIYLLIEDKERKVVRRRRLRQLLRVWVEMKRAFQPVAPVFKGIENLVRFILRVVLPFAIFFAAILMSPLLGLAMGLGKLSNRARALPMLGPPLKVCLDFTSLALVALAVIGIGALIPLFLCAQLLPERRREIA